jgi:hypothetical protein
MSAVIKVHLLPAGYFDGCHGSVKQSHSITELCNILNTCVKSQIPKENPNGLFFSFYICKFVTVFMSAVQNYSN